MAKNRKSAESAQPIDIKGMKDAELDKMIRKMRAKAAKRTYSLSHKAPSSPALRSAVTRGLRGLKGRTGAGKHALTKMTRAQKEREAYELESWLNLETSTVTGTRRFEKRIDEILGHQFGADEKDEIFAIRDTLVAEFPSLYPHESDMRHRRGSPELLDDIADLKAQGMGPKEIMDRMYDRLLEQQMEMKEGEDDADKGGWSPIDPDDFFSR